MEANDRWPASTTARVAGAFYLLYMLASILANALGSIGLGAGPQVYAAITTHGDAFRLALVVAFACGLLFTMAAWALYVLLRPVDAPLALLFLVLNAVGVAIQAASLLFLIGALAIGDGTSLAASFTAGQAQALSSLFIDVYKLGFVSAQLFFGAWLFPLGYLVYRSTVLPRLIGVLLILDGVAELIWFTQALVLPGYPAIHYPGTAVSLVAELGLALWLLVKGVKTDASGTTRIALTGHAA